MLRTVLPVVLLALAAVAGVGVWLINGAAHPPHHAYLVTPEKFLQLNPGGLKATEETWTNRDGTKARGWLLRGVEGAPAVILLHSYGADRSWYLNLGIKLNETTNFTVLWPDLRGHGENPPVNGTAFGAQEADDIAAAIDFLRTLKTPQARPLVSDQTGLYGVEMGGYIALKAASQNKTIRALALDSVPSMPDDVLHRAVTERVGFDNKFLQTLGRWSARIYFLGKYENTPACDLAAQLGDRHTLLVSGPEVESLRNSTNALAGCFPNPKNVEAKTDLPLTGSNLPSATGEQGEAYDRRVIEFFDKALRNGP